MTLEAHYSQISASEKRMHPWAKGKVQYAKTENGNREWTGEFSYCEGKPHARRLANELGATPWNF